MHIYIYICIHTYNYMDTIIPMEALSIHIIECIIALSLYIYIYIYIQRERDTERERCIYVQMCTYGFPPYVSHVTVPDFGQPPCERRARPEPGGVRRVANRQPEKHLVQQWLQFMLCLYVLLSYVIYVCLLIVMWFTVQAKKKCPGGKENTWFHMASKNVCILCGT